MPRTASSTVPVGPGWHLGPPATRKEKAMTAPWWETDNYDLPGVNDGPNMDDPALWGSNGPALVRLYDSGMTDPGWGLVEKKGEGPGFMLRYNAGDFTPRRILHGYARGFWAFAWVMRAAKMVCIDIDGKNGGLQNVTKLGELPPTCAEKSKSGNGYHLFYRVEDDWDPVEGFAGYRDQLGIEEGVDIRGVGCVYHYPTQRWNARSPMMLPKKLRKKLGQPAASFATKLTQVTTQVLTLTREEVMIMHDSLLQDLAKPIPIGKRNNTLFAIGSNMKAAGVENWEDLVFDRALEVGLDSVEADKLVKNIDVYS